MNDAAPTLAEDVEYIKENANVCIGVHTQQANIRENQTRASEEPSLHQVHV